MIEIYLPISYNNTISGFKRMTMLLFNSFEFKKKNQWVSHTFKNGGSFKLPTAIFIATFVNQIKGKKDQYNAWVPNDFASYISLVRLVGSN